MSDRPTKQTTALLHAIKAEGRLLYVDEWARLLNWTVEDVNRAARQLRDAGLLSLHSAPHGVLVTSTLRGAA
jgi:predicted transcriptional regulator